MFLAEKDIAIALVQVDLVKGEQHSDAYRAINPRRVVPTLVLEDGTAIGEVLAIWRYLEEVYPIPALLGSTPREKALVTMWERRAELEGFAAVMDNAVERLKRRAIAGPHDYDQIPALVERSKLRVRDFYADLNARLTEEPFVAGNQFSAADITALVTVDFARTPACRRFERLHCRRPLLQVLGVGERLLPDGEKRIEGLAEAHTPTPGARLFPFGDQIATLASCAANIGRRLTGDV
jgi:glutathione S-transferase